MMRKTKLRHRELSEAIQFRSWIAASPAAPHNDEITREAAERC